MVRQPCVAGILPIHRSSMNGLYCISSLDPALCQTRVEDILTFFNIYQLSCWTISDSALEVDIPLKGLISTGITKSTAVGQAVAWAPVKQRVRVRSPVGTSFLGEGFSGFSWPVRQMSGSFRPPRSPNIIWPLLSSSIIIHYGRQWPEMLTRPKTSNIQTYRHYENWISGLLDLL